MIRVLKKGLFFIFVLVITSILFNVSANSNLSSSAGEVVEIIESASGVLQDGYVDEVVEYNNSSNVFASLVGILANLIESVFSLVLNFVSKVISSFAG